jgi:hypothetical protein
MQRLWEPLISSKKKSRQSSFLHPLDSSRLRSDLESLDTKRRERNTGGKGLRLLSRVDKASHIASSESSKESVLSVTP